jgi:hypothetical protein
VSKATPILTLAASPDWSVSYGETTVSCSASSSQVTPQLFKNNSAVQNPHVATLAVGSYNYSCNATETQNYTSAQVSNILTINKANSRINLTFDSVEGNKTVTQGSSVNITATLLAGEGLMQLYLQNELINEGGSPLTNITTFSTTGSYNVTAVYLATQNYTSSSATYFITVQAAPAPSQAGGGGGGGGGGVSAACIENWSCTDWTPCSVAGMQTRSCTDVNSCNTTAQKPETTRNCTYLAPAEKAEEKKPVKKIEEVEKPAMPVQPCALDWLLVVIAALFLAYFSYLIYKWYKEEKKLFLWVAAAFFLMITAILAYSVYLCQKNLIVLLATVLIAVVAFIFMKRKKKKKEVIISRFK